MLLIDQPACVFRADSPMPSAIHRGIHTTAQGMDVVPSTLSEKRTGHSSQQLTPTIAASTTNALSRLRLWRKPRSRACCCGCFGNPFRIFVRLALAGEMDGRMTRRIFFCKSKARKIAQ